jgi:hypothetical protein
VPKAASKKGLSPQVFTGLNQKRIEASGGGSGKRMAWRKERPTELVQFLTNIDGFREYFIHSWQEDARWQFVPCAGEGCPLCESEDDAQARKQYRFCANVYNFANKKVQIMEGPQGLATRIFQRYKAAPAKFLKRTYEVTKFPTKPVTYNFERGDVEDQPVRSTTGLKLYDLDEYILEEMQRYYGEDMPATSDLEADDDEEFDDEEDLEDEDDLDDEDEEDEDEEDEDDEDEEDDEDLDEDDGEEDDEPPARSRRAPAKRAPAKRAPAKRAPAKRAPARGRR